ncbi:hypothetical protein L195_g035381 [Trifolium pratense]|uniref:Uncharacterized protein n=1 Tax=Trifolium pratense TaxID=57577 RepID=A0A2K3LLH4_TRIPR|nr:hypothetical protein L195_g035381 [Trifolium pratense]
MLHDQCCIYNVPNHLLKLNEDAYTPKFISIGPFHSHNSELNQEKQKQRYFHAFWKRLSNKQASALVQFKAFLEDNRENIGNFYCKQDVCQNDKFVEMILLDSVFVMELFLRKANESEQKNDYMFTTSWIYKITQRDLLLLENQIPMFVLEELHKRVFLLSDNNGCNKENCVSFIELAFNYFEDYYPQKLSSKDEMIRNCKSCKHFTDLIRYSYLPREIQVKGVNPSENFTPFRSEYVLRTATKLNEAGCVPCLKVVESKLQIPHLNVDQGTECVLRNLIAFEQCHYSDQPFICNYVSLIDSLIHTHEDVELLVDTEIINHELGSHAELATLVNCLCKCVVVTSNCYGEVVKELNEHYNNRWKHYMGMLRSVYFRDPWRLSSTVVGVAIFLFAIVNFLRVIEKVGKGRPGSGASEAGGARIHSSCSNK